MLVLSACQSDSAIDMAAAEPPPPEDQGGLPDVSDLVGAPAAATESQLFARGYLPKRMSGGTAYWWNETTAVCAKVVRSDGYTKSITDEETSRCGL